MLGQILTVLALKSMATVDRPQYLCINAIGEGQVPTQAAINGTLQNLSGATRSADGTRRLCMSAQWSVQGKGANSTKMLEQLDDFLALSLANDLPVSISVDATQWWENAEHLWNFWNKSRPTYNPDNVNNVEWTGWTPENAPKISWRNWGSQFRITDDPGVYTPPPNFGSPAFRAASAEAMLPLIRRIAQWYKALPASKKNLLAYVRSTQELWTGTNYWYYKNGNDLIDKNVSDDPKCGPSCAAQLGYAAVCVSGGACSGNLTIPQLDATINSFCEFANGVLVGVGIPRSRIMCHTGFGTNHRGKGHPIMNTPAASVTTNGAPAWSMYIGSSPIRTRGGLSLNASLDSIDSTPWGAPEWMPFNLLGGKGTASQWDFAFDDILSYRNNRLVVIQNWNSIWKPYQAVAIAALARAVATPPLCLVGTATAMGATKVNDTAYELHWSPGTKGETQTILASVILGLLPSGALAAPTLLSVDLPPTASSATLILQTDPSYEVVQWQVVTRGCKGTQTAVADVETLVL
jgi:hypothetical protein